MAPSLGVISYRGTITGGSRRFFDIFDGRKALSVRNSVTAWGFSSANSLRHHAAHDKELLSGEVVPILGEF